MITTNYISKNLLPDEQLLFRTTKHPIIFLTPCILLLIALFFATDNHITNTIHSSIHYVFRSTSLEGLLQRLPLLLVTLIAVYSGLRQWLMYVTSEYAVTNKRVVMREGFFQRYVCDTRLSTISNVGVDQNLLAQALNYGTITINSFGGSSDFFSQVAMPNEFQKFVHAQLDKTAR